MVESGFESRPVWLQYLHRLHVTHSPSKLDCKLCKSRNNAMLSPGYLASSRLLTRQQVLNTCLVMNQGINICCVKYSFHQCWSFHIPPAMLPLSGIISTTDHYFQEPRWCKGHWHSLGTANGPLFTQPVCEAQLLSYSRDYKLFCFLHCLLPTLNPLQEAKASLKSSNFF